MGDNTDGNYQRITMTTSQQHPVRDNAILVLSISGVASLIAIGATLYNIQTSVIQNAVTIENRFTKLETKLEVINKHLDKQEQHLMGGG